MLVTGDRSDRTLLWDSRAGQDTSHVHPEWTISDRSSKATLRLYKDISMNITACRYLSQSQNSRHFEEIPLWHI